MARAAEALKLPGKPITRNVKACAGSARCLQGCPREARQSMDVSFVPLASPSARCTLLAAARADRDRGGRGARWRVRCRLLEPRAGSPRGASGRGAALGVSRLGGQMFTPLLLQKAGLPVWSASAFRRTRALRGGGPLPTSPWARGSAPRRPTRCRMRGRRGSSSSPGLPPELLAARLPGVGASGRLV